MGSELGALLESAVGSTAADHKRHDPELPPKRDRPRCGARGRTGASCWALRFGTQKPARPAMGDAACTEAPALVQRPRRAGTLFAGATSGDGRGRTQYEPRIVQ